MGTTLDARKAGLLRIGDLEVVRLGFGAMRLTGPGIWGEPRDRADARKVLQRAVELGVTFIDTADSYGPRVSEELIAEALYPYPSQLVIATKGGLLRDGPGLWRPNGRPEHLRQACEGSLKRLRVERIDLYQFHRIDPNVPLEDSLGTLVELQREGKIRHIGVSNFGVDQLERAQAMARVVSVQNRYNVFDRVSEPVLDRCEREGLAFLPWAPVGGGEELGTLAPIAARHGATMTQVALAWLLDHSPVMTPIPGTSSIEHFEENVAAAGLELSPEETKALDQIALGGTNVVGEVQQSEQTT
jgi:aryl-alcohol dehydrogenase-like predicted oxidoreductase